MSTQTARFELWAGTRILYVLPARVSSFGTLINKHQRALLGLVQMTSQHVVTRAPLTLLQHTRNAHCMSVTTHWYFAGTIYVQRFAFTEI